MDKIKEIEEFINSCWELTQEDEFASNEARLLAHDYAYGVIMYYSGEISREDLEKRWEDASGIACNYVPSPEMIIEMFGERNS